MPDHLGVLARRIDGSRMRELLVDFANLRLGAGSSIAAAEWFAGLLRASGAVEARVHGRNLSAPVVVAGFPGVQRAPTLQFLGYFAVHGGGSRKAFAAGGYVHGPDVTSGAAGLIAAAEAARVLAAHGPMPGGGLLFTARASIDRADAGSDIGRLIDMGIAGQATVITSGPANILPVMGQGTCMFEVRFTIPDAGLSSFEGHSSAIDAAHAFCGAVRRHHIAAARVAHGTAGPETAAVGSVGGGDRYDSAARSSWLKGVWRHGLDRTAADVRGELERIARRVAAACGARASITVAALQAPYRLDVTSSPVDDLATAYRAVWGRDLPMGVNTSPCDVPLFLSRGIPAVCHGPLPSASETASDVECVSVEDMTRLAEVYTRLALNYLHRGTGSSWAKFAPCDQEELGEQAVGERVALGAVQGLAR